MCRVLRLTILAVLSCAVCGCHSNAAQDETPATRSATVADRQAAEDSANDSTSAPIASDANDHRPIIVCFGDSLTAGFGAGPGQSYPDYLQADLTAQHREYHVVNAGVSGETTKDGVQRLPEVLALHPYLVVVEFGGNDGLRGVRIEDTRAAFDTILTTLQRSGTRLVLAGITLPPDYGPDYIQRFDRTYTLMAAKYHVPLLPFLLKDVYGVPGLMQRDNTHATARGNQIVAENVLPLVLPLLKR